MTIIEKTLKYSIKIQNIALRSLKRVLYQQQSLEYKNILIYRIGNIGDILCSVPAMKAVRKKYPNARITLLSNAGGATSAASILKDVEWLDEIKMYDSKDFNSIRSIYAFSSSIKQEKYDFLVNLPNVAGGFFTQLRNMFFFKLAGIEAAGNFYIHHSRILPKSQVKILDNGNEVLRLLKNLPFKCTEEPCFDFIFNSQVENKVLGELSSLGLKGQSNILAISFSCKGDCKKWDLDRFAILAQRWIENYNGYVILLGGPDDRNEGNFIINKISDDKTFNLCGDLSIQESMFLLKKVKLLVGLDTGTAHMAAAMGCMSITLFSGFDFPDIWNPYGDKSIVIRKKIECSPCLSKNCMFGFPSKCMNAISTEDVWSEIQKAMILEEGDIDERINN